MGKQLPDIVTVVLRLERLGNIYSHGWVFGKPGTGDPLHEIDSIIEGELKEGVYRHVCGYVSCVWPTDCLSVNHLRNKRNFLFDIVFLEHIRQQKINYNRSFLKLRSTLF